jgi:hypothetical protein
MIHVKRPLTLAPADWKKKAEAERKAAIAANRDALAAVREVKKNGK